MIGRVTTSVGTRLARWVVGRANEIISKATEFAAEAMRIRSTASLVMLSPKQLLLKQTAEAPGDAR